MPADERFPVTESDARFLRRVAKNDGPYFCTKADVTKARRMRTLGLVRGGHLGDRYVQLTAEGRDWLREANRHA